MIQWIVYKHTSIKSGKSYIGITKNGIDKRWKQHLVEASRGSQSHFHRAIRMYGEDNWEHTVIAHSIDTLEEAYALEKYYIKKEDTFENGYNLNEGGEGNSGLKKPEYFAINTWYHLKNPTETCSALELMDKYPYIDICNIRDYFTNNWSSVKGWTTKCPSHLRNINDKNKVIIVYHTDGSIFTGTVEDFSIFINKSLSHIGKVLSGKHKSISGWRLTEHVVPVRSKEVEGYCAKTKDLLVVYPSSFEASRHLNLSRKELMSEWLSYSGSKGKLYKGVIYKYKEPYKAKDKNIGVVR